jgi:hypothetical protein
MSYLLLPVEGESEWPEILGLDQFPQPSPCPKYKYPPNAFDNTDQCLPSRDHFTLLGPKKTKKLSPGGWVLVP